MKNITTYILVPLSTFITPCVLAQGTGALGGNPAVESGAVNISVGKCTQYKIQVKAAQKSGKDAWKFAAPKGCEAVKEN
ncbi:hypothetical protein ACP6H9_22125 [Vibrio harveyi]|uniref:hypothetical protein n=1 Tax=Vibrio harveyi TaxID=669 RepID=UPI00215BA120|nr:hypothetical protein [Vibrio harveyi]MCR9772582.1 hypothetical protein [Vibrio harveyi]